MISAIRSFCVWTAWSTWTSNMMTSVGMPALMESTSRRPALVDLPLEEIGSAWPRTVRLARTYPRFLAKEDLPEPKKPETQTPTPSLGSDGASAMA